MELMAAFICVTAIAFVEIRKYNRLNTQIKSIQDRLFKLDGYINEAAAHLKKQIYRILKRFHALEEYFHIEIVENQEQDPLRRELGIGPVGRRLFVVEGKPYQVSQEVFATEILSLKKQIERK